MKTSAHIPIGTLEENDFKLVNKGDVLQLCTGEKVTFTEMKRVKFHGIMNGRGTIVPIWRNHLKTQPFVTEVVGRDESVITVSADLKGFTPGELFSLEGQKETFMYKERDLDTGKIKAIDVATKRVWKIDANFTFVKIDLEDVKNELGKIIVR